MGIDSESSTQIAIWERCKHALSLLSSLHLFGHPQKLGLARQASREDDIISIQVDERSTEEWRRPSLLLSLICTTYTNIHTHFHTSHIFCTSTDIIVFSLLLSMLHHHLKQSLCITTPLGQWHHCIVSAPSPPPLLHPCSFCTHWRLCEGTEVCYCSHRATLIKCFHDDSTHRLMHTTSKQTKKGSWHCIFNLLDWGQAAVKAI